MQRAPQPILRDRHRSRPQWIGALLSEARRSDLAVSSSKTSHDLNKTASRRENGIRLLLILLWATVIVLGFYAGLQHHHR